MVTRVRSRRWTIGVFNPIIGGTSIGALLCMFRARKRAFDWAALVAAARRLSWNTVFRALDMDSRYGIPATLRLYLRTSLSGLFQSPNEEGRTLRFAELEIPTLVVATGLGVEALKHDLSYYEHFLMMNVAPAAFNGFLNAPHHSNGRYFKEFMSTPDALREVVFGADELTMQADVLDAAGFSSAIPGFIHYDVLRDDRHETPTRPTLWGVRDYPTDRRRHREQSAGSARLSRGHEGAYHSPQCLRVGFGLFCPYTQFCTLASRPASGAFECGGELSVCQSLFSVDAPIEPDESGPERGPTLDSMRWTRESLEDQMPFIHAMCETLRVLPEAARGTRQGLRRRGPTREWSKSMSPLPARLILYDGECGFCSRSVQFVWTVTRRNIFILRHCRVTRLNLCALGTPRYPPGSIRWF